VLTGKYTRGGENDSLRKSGNAQRGRASERGLQIARVVDGIADELGVTSTQVALAWVLARGYRLFPIAGARKVSQIKDTLGAAGLTLPTEALKKLNEATSISLGFPHEFLASDNVQNMLFGEETRSRIVRPPSE
jgi:aryl-alcohol dehydrogenase-like predicted oxidoreductase